jgi:proline dehydrogenase
MRDMSNDREGKARWALPGRRAALNWCAGRNSAGIRCILDVLGRYSQDGAEAKRSARASIAAVRAIGERSLKASLSVKLTTLGATFDRELCRRNLLSIGGTAARLNIGLDIDMEGKGLVDFTIHTAIESAGEGHPVTLTLQAYLDRTPADIERVIERAIRLRLVKGAYIGDSGDFMEVQRRFKALSARLSDSGLPFSIGTHDPELIGWARTELAGQKGLMEFGFLRGLADGTKLELARDGWIVAEYVPFGAESEAYVLRRQNHLRKIRGLGREPAP